MTLKRGHDLPNQHRREGNVPVISSSGITGFHNSPKASGPGVVTGRYGTIGKVFYTEKDYWPLNTALYVTDFKGNSPKFIAYFLENTLRGYQSEKAAVPGVDRNVLHELIVSLPPENKRARIADILSAYDDLIENNKRRMALLETSARELYREWFVRLRFPGHESTPVQDGLPEGWKRKKLGKLFTLKKETVSPDQIDNSTPYIGLEHIPRRSITLCDWETAEKVTSTKYRFAENDILFGKIRPYFHKVGFTLNDGITSSDTIVMQPTEESLFAFLLMTASSDEFVAYVSQTVKEGSKMPRADVTMMEAYDVALPNSKILKSFQETVEEMTQQLKNLSLQNQKLRHARDLLLPKLMNGEIEI